MAMAAVSDDPGDMECSVCSEPYTDPKLLVCGHLLCAHCLLSWASTNNDAQCPLCRSAMLEGARGTSGADLERYVADLPTDLAMKKLAEAQRLLARDHTCCVCANVAASTLCLTCRDMLCSSCTKVHAKLSVTKHHRVCSLTSVKPEQLVTGEPSYCQTHTQEASKVFCTAHDAAICLVCATTDHKQCPVVTQEARAQEDHSVLHQLTSQLTQGEARLEMAVKELDTRQEEARHVTESALQEGLQLCDRLDSLVHAARQRLRDLAHTASSDNERATHKARTLLLSHKARLSTHRQAAQRADQLLTSSDLTRMTSTIKDRINNHLHCSPALPADAAVAMTTLVLDTQALSSLEKSLQQELGQLHTETPNDTPSNTPSDTPIKTSTLLCQPQFSFHANHGSDVVLRDGGLVAEKQGKSVFNGIVMSSQPMEANYLYEVEVRTMPGKPQAHRMLIRPGLVTEAPDHLTLPKDAYCWESAIAVGYGATTISEKEVDSLIGYELVNRAAGSRVGVSVDDKRNMLVYLDGRCVGTVDHSVQQPVYAMFDLRGDENYSVEVAALPPTYLK